MPPFIDITGKRFGKLLVIKLAGKTADNRLTWECLCDCGITTITQGASLRSGNTTSCGCHKRSVLPLSTTTHGMANSRAYRVFHAMHNRCSNPKNKDFHSYGGRGIKVCERWRKPQGFAAFIADMGVPPEGFSIERMNTDGNYEPGNCKWATVDEQANNKRNNRLVTWQNQTRTLTGWAKMLNKPASWLFKRIAKYPIDEAMAPFNEVLLRLAQTELDQTADHTTKACIEVRIEKLTFAAR